MARRANLVLQLVEDLRRIASATGVLPPSVLGASPNGERGGYVGAAGGGGLDREREGEDKIKMKGSKKRPWEDGGGADGDGGGGEEGMQGHGQAERTAEDVCVVFAARRHLLRCLC